MGSVTVYCLFKRRYHRWDLEKKDVKSFNHRNHYRLVQQILVAGKIWNNLYNLVQSMNLSPRLLAFLITTFSVIPQTQVYNSRRHCQKKKDEDDSSKESLYKVSQESMQPFRIS